MHIGQRMRDGAVLYRDAWDIRQPLTFVWFAIVGVLGSSGVVVRLGEIAWQACLAALIARDVERTTSDRAVAVLTAVAAVGSLFWMGRADDVAQPDTLVLLPLYLVFRAITLPGRTPLRPRTVSALGVATIVVALFKIVYAPIPVVFLVLWCVHHRPARGVLVRGWIGFVGGALAATAATAAFFAAEHVLGWVLHTWLVQGPAMRGLAPPPFARFVTSAGRVGIWMAPLWVAAAVAVAGLRRPPRSLAISCATGWVVVAAVAFAAQSWWSYQALSVVVPVGLLGGPVLAGWLRTPVLRRASLAAALVASLAFHRGYLSTVVLDHLDADAIEHELQPSLVDADLLRDFLAEPDRLAGDVYVFGDPTMVLRSGRADRTAIHGWSPEFYDTETWARLADELTEEAPAYVVVDPFSAGYLADRAPTISAWLQDEYAVVDALPSGIAIWEHRTAG